jgi:hypothetical protein
MKMIPTSRTYKVRDYSADTKDGKNVYKEKTKYPELTIVGKPELGQMKFGEEVTVKIKIKATGFSSRRDYESDGDGDVKIPEATFEVLAIEVPDSAMPVSKKAFSDSDYDPLEDMEPVSAKDSDKD